MFAAFENYITGQAHLSDDEIKLIRSLAVEKKLRRKQFILQQGEVCRYKIFVTQGLLSSYTTHPNGSQHIMQFSPENSWTTDPESLENSSASRFNIAALEPSEVILWTKKDFRHLIDNIPGLKTYFGQLVLRSGFVFRQRILSGISLTAEEKYEEFMKNFPNLAARVPLHMVASYLGVTRETLSRIRRAQLIKK